MMIPFVLPETIERIARGAVSLEQLYSYHSNGWDNRYCIRVIYPNRLGASINVKPKDGKNVYEVVLLLDGKVVFNFDRRGYVWSNLTEEEMYRHCDRILSFQSS